MTKNLFLTLFLTVLATSCYSQYFRTCQLLTNDSANLRHWNPQPDNLASLLIDGYMKGKINCYTNTLFNKPDYELPVGKFKEWTSNKQYDVYDSVIYQGEYFQAMFDVKSSMAPNTDQNAWAVYEPVRKFIRNNFRFPDDRDTLTKNEFNKRMLGHPNFEPRETWNPNHEYFQGEQVEWEGKVYVALENSVNKALTEASYWDLMGYLYFMTSPNEFNLIEFFEYCEVQNGDTLFYPQMVSLGKYVGDDRRQTSLHFRFKDVIQYLETLNQPLITFPKNETYGWFTKSNFIFDQPQGSVILAAKIRELLLLRKIKLDKKEIINPLLFNAYLKDTSAVNDPATQYPWILFQIPSGLWLARSYDNPGLVAKIPVQQLTRELTKIPGVDHQEKIMTLSQGLVLKAFTENQHFISEADSLPVDKPTFSLKEPQTVAYQQALRIDLKSAVNKLAIPNPDQLGQTFVQMAEKHVVNLYDLLPEFFEYSKTGKLALRSYDTAYFRSLINLNYISVVFDFSFSRIDEKLTMTPVYLTAVYFDPTMGVELYLNFFKLGDLEKIAPGNPAIAQLMSAIRKNLVQYSNAEFYQGFYQKPIR